MPVKPCSRVEYSRLEQLKRFSFNGWNDALHLLYVGVNIIVHFQNVTSENVHLKKLNEANRTIVLYLRFAHLDEAVPPVESEFWLDFLTATMCLLLVIRSA